MSRISRLPREYKVDMDKSVSKDYDLEVVMFFAYRR